MKKPLVSDRPMNGLSKTRRVGFHPTIYPAGGGVKTHPTHDDNGSIFARFGIIASAAILVFGFAAPVLAQSQSGHDTMNHSAHSAQGAETAQNATVAPETPTETGQSAFAAIAEIVLILQADPNTDWNAVNIDALRAHLTDMNAVTLLSDVVTSHIHGGAVFEVTSSDAKTASSISRMLLAHGATMSGADGMDMASVEVEGGARMTVTGPNPAMIRGLGFFGVMTLGMHHQAHHMALALGSDPHQ